MAILHGGDKIDSSDTILAFEFSPDRAGPALREFEGFLGRVAPGTAGFRSLYALAELYSRRGEDGEAARVLTGLLALPHRDVFDKACVQIRLAEVIFRMGRLTEAGRWHALAAAAGAPALRPEALLGQALAAAAHGDREAADRFYATLMTSHPHYRDIERLALPLGLFHWDLRRPADALEFFKKDGKSPAGLFFSGMCLRRLGKSIDAAGTFRRIVREHAATSWAERARFELGETFYQGGDPLLARQAFLEILQGNPRPFWEALALYRLACVDMRAKDAPAAEEKLWEVNRHSLPGSLAADAVLLLSDALASQNKISWMIRLLESKTDLRNSPEISYRMVWARAAAGHYEAAVRLADELLKGAWDSEVTPKVLLVQGYAFENLQRFSEASASYQLVVERFPARLAAAQAVRLAAMAAARASQWNVIVTQVNRLWNLVPPAVQKRCPDALFWIAEAHARLGNGREAQRFYEEFLKTAGLTHPLAGTALRNEAVALAAERDDGGALAVLQRAYQHAQDKGDKPFLARVVVDMGDVSFNAKAYENAASFYRQLETIDPASPSLPGVLMRTGAALHRAQYYQDAVGAWEGLAARFPISPEAPDALFRASKTRFNMGQYPEAVAGYKKLLRVHGLSSFAQAARLQIGQCHYNSGRYLEAIAVYQDYLRRHPDDARALNVVEMLQMAGYQAKMSPEEIERLIRGGEKSAVLADAYWEEGARKYNEKKYFEARGYFQRLIVEFPSSSLASQAVFFRAECFFLEEEFAEAAAAYDHFLAGYPEDAQAGVALFHRAASLFSLKDFGGAAEAFTRFVRKFPDDSMAKNAALNAALASLKAEDPERAVQAAVDYGALYPDAEDLGGVFLQLGQFLEKAGRDGPSIEAWLRVPVDRPERPEALYRAAQAEGRRKNAEGERRAYEGLGGMSPKNNPYRIAGLLQWADILAAAAAGGRPGFSDGAANDPARAAVLLIDVAENGDELSRAAAKERLDSLPGGER